MRRYLIILGAALALLATACGGGPTDEEFKAQLTDGGFFSDEQADCVVEKLHEAGINPGDLTDQSLGDDEPPAEAIAITTECLFDGEFSDDIADSISDSDANSYGDDPALDSLYDGCEAGDMQACDDLYLESPFGSEYEAFGDSCGDRREPAGFCA